jgi:3-oxoacyl-[acyl-carrier-protein] synthase-1
MEAVAVARAGLQEVPLNSLKGYFGHTMGAAGVLETVLSMQALNDHLVLATRGFEELGVSRPVRLSVQNEAASGCSFVKLLSGFGGCNAAMLFRKGGEL